MCLGRESNPHGLFGPRDFKSLVSTIPPPRLGVCAKVKHFTGIINRRRAIAEAGQGRVVCEQGCSEGSGAWPQSS